jgi:hypothetical protein
MKLDPSAAPPRISCRGNRVRYDMNCLYEGSPKCATRKPDSGANWPVLIFPYNLAPYIVIAGP